MRALLGILLVLGSLTACGDDDSVEDAVDDAVEEATDAAGSTQATGETTQDDGAGDAEDAFAAELDCDAIRAESATFVAVQLMAQVRDPSSIETLKSDSMGLDLEGFIATMEALHALDGYDEPPFGSPRDAIDGYVTAASALRELLEADSVTQADIDAYNELIGETGDFLSGQATIGAALDAACPD